MGGATAGCAPVEAGRFEVDPVHLRAVALDVLRGYVSAGSAAGEYGVTILPDGRGDRRV